MPHGGGRRGHGGGGGGGRSHHHHPVVHHHRPIVVAPIYRPTPKVVVVTTNPTPTYYSDTHYHSTGPSYASSAYSSTPSYSSSYSSDNSTKIKQLLGVGCCCFFILFIIGLSVGLAAASGGSHTFAPAETYKIDYSTSFTASVKVKDNGQVFLYDYEPPANVVVNETFSRSVYIDFDGYQYWYWNLRPGSSVSISTCTPGPQGVQFLIFRGSNSFNSWVDDSYSSTWVVNIPYSPGPCTDQYGGNGFYQLSVNSEDTYYFVYTIAYSTTNVNFTMNLRRLEYDTSSGYLSTCAATCTTDLEYQSAQFLIVQAPGSQEVDDGYNISWSVSGRGWLWFLIFICIFLVCGLPCFIYACFLKMADKCSRKDGYTPLSDSTPAPIETTPISSSPPITSSGLPPSMNPNIPIPTTESSMISTPSPAYSPYGTPQQPGQPSPYQQPYSQPLSPPPTYGSQPTSYPPPTTIPTTYVQPMPTYGQPMPTYGTQQPPSQQQPMTYSTPYPPSSTSPDGSSGLPTYQSVPPPTYQSPPSYGEVSYQAPPPSYNPSSSS